MVPRVDGIISMGRSVSCDIQCLYLYSLKYFQREYQRNCAGSTIPTVWVSWNNRTDYFDLKPWYDVIVPHVIVARWFYCGTNRRARSWQEPSFSLLSSILSFVVLRNSSSSGFYRLVPTSNERGLRLSENCAAWSRRTTSLSVNYLLIILFILTLTKRPRFCFQVSIISGIVTLKEHLVIYL